MDRRAVLLSLGAIGAAVAAAHLRPRDPLRFILAGDASLSRPATARQIDGLAGLARVAISDENGVMVPAPARGSALALSFGSAVARRTGDAVEITVITAALPFYEWSREIYRRAEPLFEHGTLAGMIWSHRGVTEADAIYLREIFDDVRASSLAPIIAVDHGGAMPSVPGVFTVACGTDAIELGEACAQEMLWRLA